MRMQNRCAVQGLARFRHSAFRVRRCRDFTGAPLQTTSPSLGLVQPEQAISRAERTLLACAGAARKGGAPPPAPPHRDDARRCASVLPRYQGLQRYPKFPCKGARTSVVSSARLHFAFFERAFTGAVGFAGAPPRWERRARIKRTKSSRRRTSRTRAAPPRRPARTSFRSPRRVRHVPAHPLRPASVPR